MKKIALVLMLIIMVMGCNNGNYSKLKYDDLKEKLDNKETFILLFNNNSDEGNLLKNTLETVLVDNNLKAYEINPDKLTENQKNALRPYFSYEDVSIIFIKKGIDPSKLTHITNELTTIKELTTHLTNLGFIKTSE